MRSLRLVGLLLSLVACAWFGLGIRQAHDTDQASAIVSSPAALSTAQVHRAAALLRAAKQLNPDTEVDVLRAQLALDQGDRPGARAILEQVVADEPSNVEAWLWLARASPGDPRWFYAAAYRIRQLVPPVPLPR